MNTKTKPFTIPGLAVYQKIYDKMKEYELKEACDAYPDNADMHNDEDYPVFEKKIYDYLVLTALVLEEDGMVPFDLKPDGLEQTTMEDIARFTDKFREDTGLDARFEFSNSEDQFQCLLTIDYLDDETDYDDEIDYMDEEEE